MESKYLKQDMVEIIIGFFPLVYHKDRSIQKRGEEGREKISMPLSPTHPFWIFVYTFLPSPAYFKSAPPIFPHPTPTFLNGIAIRQKKKDGLH